MNECYLINNINNANVYCKTRKSMNVIKKNLNRGGCNFPITKSFDFFIYKLMFNFYI